MKRRWVAIGLALLLLTGCIERPPASSTPPVSSAPSAASVVEGGAEEIDLGDPNERTELCGGRFDLNPALPRTLDERRAALLAQLDLSDCGVIGLTPVGADEEVALPAGATAQSVLLRADADFGCFRGGRIWEGGVWGKTGVVRICRFPVCRERVEAMGEQKTA